MHIKYVLIKKFKSYRDLSYMEPLSEGVNLVVGANGHGKSNFLDAIIFVLTDKYSNLRGEDKKLLVHEEPNEVISQISVELIIDNKSRRFPVDKDTVSINKIYHVEENREEILINGKKLMRSDVYNLLESAGFCKSHPYYIIQQGKINTIINMNEFELFEQFAEVTGTSVYEEKKVESLKLLEEAKDNKNKISRQKEEINDYILRLEAQCEDLTSFEKFEAKKKACEFLIFNEKISDYQVNIDLLQERRTSNSSSLQTLCTNLNLIKEKISEKTSLSVKFNKHIESLKAKVKRIDQEISNIHSYTSKEQANLQMFNQETVNNSQIKKGLEQNLKEIRSEKEKCNLDILKTSQKVRDLDNEIENITAKFNEVKGSSEFAGILLGKGKTFIKAELNSLAKIKEELNSKILSLNSTVGEEEQGLKHLESQISEIDKEKNEAELSLRAVNNNLINYKKERVELVNNMKKLDLNNHELDSEIESLKENQKLLERQLPNAEVVKAIREIKSLNLPGCYGILLDLIKTDKRYRNSIDIFAKDKLYSIVVDTVDTADKILEFNKSRNGPVIDIIPLEWNAGNKPFNYPQTADAMPLIGLIHPVDENLKELLNPVINKIFGKCLLVKSYEVAMNLAHSYNLTCITPENEVVYAGGYVTKVGHYDYRRNRCTLYETLEENQAKFSILNINKNNLSSEKQNFSNQENLLMRECNSCLTMKNELTIKIQNLIKNKQTLEEEIMSLKEISGERKRIIDQLLREKSNIEQKSTNVSNLLNQNSQSVTTELNPEEQKEVQRLEKKLIDLEKARNLILNQKISAESRLNDYLNKKELELVSQLNEISSLSESVTFDFTEEKAVIKDIENNLKELENLNFIKSRMQDEINKTEKEIEFVNSEISSLKSDSGKINERINKNEAELKAVVLSLNDSNEKKNTLLKNLAALGQIKSENLDKYTKMKEAQIKLMQNESNIDIRDTEKKLNKILQPIYASLESINRKMKKFEKINRFAIDDYKLFKSKREEVAEKMEDLQSKEDELLEVIQVLDQKKESAIQTTFEKVSKSFEYFFKELVPNGYANLSLENVNVMTGQSQKNNSQNKSNFSKAIYINVSFSGFQNAVQSMNQLSGGQKTAVAVALIFALSKIDPPPFYILDEIDAALDPSMRTNLASLIKELSKSNQYIISTFKPEILEVSNNIYQVKFLNKTSNMNKVVKEEAQKFIKDINL